MARVHFRINFIRPELLDNFIHQSGVPAPKWVDLKLNQTQCIYTLTRCPVCNKVFFELKVQPLFRKLYSQVMAYSHVEYIRYFFKQVTFQQSFSPNKWNNADPKWNSNHCQIFIHPHLIALFHLIFTLLYLKYRINIEKKKHIFRLSTFLDLLLSVILYTILVI